MEKHNKNRAYKNLEVWQNAIDLYALSVRELSGFSFEHKKSAGNAIDAANSISRNIAEGYCRNSTREYLLFLNYSIASAGEFHSCIYGFSKAGLITSNTYKDLDDILFEIENKLIKLITSLRNKLK